MSIDLSDRQQIASLDKANVLGSIEQLPDQIQDAWNETAHHNWKEYAKNVTHVVVAGMGGSALGAEVIKSLAKQSLKVPLEIVKDYTLPHYVNEQTLVLLSSYSGTTEETLSCANDAMAKHAKIAVMTSGGELKNLAEKHQYPSYIINPRYNPSNQPRMAIGYMIAGQIGLLNSFGLIDSSSFNIRATIDFLKAQMTLYQPETVENIAVQLARSVEDRIIYLISGEHLTGATHVMNNQINENAKHLTVELQLPELNHHYMEGLPNPTAVKQGINFFMINSQLYSDKLQLRLRLTQDVIEKNGYSTKIINLTADNPFTQAFELIQLGSYINFYLAMMHGINPAPIPWVDYFKDQLHKAS